VLLCQAAIGKSEPPNVKSVLEDYRKIFLLQVAQARVITYVELHTKKSGLLQWVVNMVHANFSPSRSQNLKPMEHSIAHVPRIRVFHYFQVLWLGR
jgi:hypothetical protein